MATYYAIARQNGHWVYVSSGPNPEEVYREAIDLVEAHEGYGDDEEGFEVSPTAESELDTLRVVPEETAREQYHVVFPRWVQVD